MRVLYTINGQDGYVADVQFEGEARPAQVRSQRRTQDWGRGGRLQGQTWGRRDVGV